MEGTSMFLVLLILTAHRACAVVNRSCYGTNQNIPGFCVPTPVCSSHGGTVVTALPNSCAVKGDQNPSDLYCCVKNDENPSNPATTTVKPHLGIQNPPQNQFSTKKTQLSIPKVESSSIQAVVTSDEIISSTLITEASEPVVLSSAPTTGYFSSNSTSISPSPSSASIYQTCMCLNSKGYCGRPGIDCENGCATGDTCPGSLVCCPSFGVEISSNEPSTEPVKSSTATATLEPVEPVPSSTSWMNTTHASSVPGNSSTIAEISSIFLEISTFTSITITTTSSSDESLSSSTSNFAMSSAARFFNVSSLVSSSPGTTSTEILSKPVDISSVDQTSTVSSSNEGSTTPKEVSSTSFDVSSFEVTSAMEIATSPGNQTSTAASPSSKSSKTPPEVSSRSNDITSLEEASTIEAATSSRTQTSTTASFISESSSQLTELSSTSNDITSLRETLASATVTLDVKPGDFTSETSESSTTMADFTPSPPKPPFVNSTAALDIASLGSTVATDISSTSNSTSADGRAEISITISTFALDTPSATDSTSVAVQSEAVTSSF